MLSLKGKKFDPALTADNSRSEQDLDVQRDFRKSALDLIIKSFENHKNHARFQEQQRSWFFIAYLTLSGVLINGIFANFQKDGFIITTAKPVLIMILGFHIIVSILVMFMISKVSREFRRHFRQADLIIQKLISIDTIRQDPVTDMLASISLGTSGDMHTGIRRFIAKRLGVAAIHNYILSLFIGFDAGLMLFVSNNNSIISVVAFVITTATAVVIFTYHNKVIDTNSR